MENKYHNIYFLGIGGIGMSALAQYFHLNNYKVAGYDRFQSDNCKRLENIGIDIHYEDNCNLIPKLYKNQSETLIVYTPAIPTDSTELAYFKTQNFEILKRAEVLGMISLDKTGIAVAGTHGKTSVSTIAAWILSNTKDSCSAFLGGVSKNFGSNLHINAKSNIIVAEADEFDRSFLHLTPSTAVITSIEADHLDIYNDFETLQEAFIQFANKIKPGGNLILHKSIQKKIFETPNKSFNIYTYGLNDENCDYNLKNITYKNNNCYFDIETPDKLIKNIKYQIGGQHNLENALAATAAALLNNADKDSLKNSLESFAGVIRRFDIKIKDKDIIYIDDYAHHPGEIKAFMNAVAEIYPNKKITAVFQPHLFSRTKDFYKEFAESLSNCHELVLLPIYPAREKPIEGINSEIIYKYA
ncbi:MAG: UDP-N-acetylmuramate--L-alanine ligase, partial [Bacteroidales bacterium]|nr:UDP-N-acetylmuramate--L-alanine ligase [Bacteroidales bacterium]